MHARGSTQRIGEVILTNCRWSCPIWEVSSKGFQKLVPKDDSVSWRKGKGRTGTRERYASVVVRCRCKERGLLVRSKATGWFDELLLSFSRVGRGQ